MTSTAASGPSLKRKESMVTREGDQLIITPLGAGNEVGRSCVYMTYKNKTVLVNPFHLFLFLLFFFIFQLGITQCVDTKSGLVCYVFSSGALTAYVLCYVCRNSAVSGIDGRIDEI